MEFVDIPILQMMLLTIVFLSLFVEIKMGGMGAGVFLGLVAAGVFFGSQYVKGLVELYQIGIFLLGIVCILISFPLWQPSPSLRSLPESCHPANSGASWYCGISPRRPEAM